MSPAVDLIVERRDATALLTINRAEKMNALLAGTVDRLRDALLDAEADPEVRAAVITGTGRGFCAGADLTDADFDARRVLREHYNPLIETIGAVELPVIAAVNGTAAGAGVSLALAADLVIAAEGAELILAFVRVGLVPDAGLTWLLPRALGRARAFELAALGGRLSTERAAELGLVNSVVEPDRVLDEALALAARLAAGPRAVSLIKRAIRGAPTAGLATQLEAEADLQAEAADSADCAEAIAAFREKREPRFTGS